MLTLVTALMRVLIRSLWVPGSPVAHLDNLVLVNLHGFAQAHRGYAEAMRLTSAIGAVMWWVLFTPICLWLVWKRRRRPAILIAATAIGSSLLNAAAKTIIGRTRPLLDDPTAIASGSSFPSGHTQAAVVGTTLLIVVCRSQIPNRFRAATAAVAVALAIGFSRLALGVHYLSDVIGGTIVGLAWVTAMIAAYLAWESDLNVARADTNSHR